MKALVLILNSLIVLFGQESADLTDYLRGYGNFSNPQAINEWRMTSADYVHNIIDSGNDKALEINKMSGNISFREGYKINFVDSQPQHLRFYFASSNKEIEDTNIRLKKSNTTHPLEEKSAVSFRCGYAGFVRVNDNQMVTFYNSTISTSAAQIWTKADIILHWNDKVVDIYINESLAGTANFYHEEIESADQVMIYNLHPQTLSWWKGIEVCKERCANFNQSLILIGLISLILLLL